MASNEKSFKRELIKAFAEVGAHIVGVNDRFAAGISDLYVKTPGWVGVWLELKYISVVNAVSVPIALTPLQRRFLGREREAGGEAGWVVCAEIPGDLWVACAGWNPMQERAHLKADRATVRARGEIWDITAILKKVVRYGS